MGKVKLELPWGETREVNDFAAPSVLDEIGRQAALPEAARDYSALFALLDAESGQGTVQADNFLGTRFPGGRNFPTVVPTNIPRAVDVGTPVVKPRVLDAWQRLFIKG